VQGSLNATNPSLHTRSVVYVRPEFGTEASCLQASAPCGPPSQQNPGPHGWTKYPSGVHGHLRAVGVCGGQIWPVACVPGLTGLSPNRDPRKFAAPYVAAPSTAVTTNTPPTVAAVPDNPSQLPIVPKNPVPAVVPAAPAAAPAAVPAASVMP